VLFYPAFFTFLQHECDNAEHFLSSIFARRNIIFMLVLLSDSANVPSFVCRNGAAQKNSD